MGMGWSRPASDTDSSSDSDESGARRVALLKLDRAQTSSLIAGVSSNPFLNPNERNWGPYDIFKLVLLGPTLLPIRLVVMVLCLIVAGLCARLAIIGVPLRERNGCFYHTDPLPKWRQVFLVPTVLLCRLVGFCLGFWGVTVIDHRGDRARHANMTVVAPHMTDFDVIMLCNAFHALPSMVSNSDILNAPLLNWVVTASQSIFIDVAKVESREESKKVIQDRASPSWEGPRMGIFPEGRITNGKMLIQFRLGPFLPGEPVQPVILRYPHKYFDPGGQSGVNRSRVTGLVKTLTQFVNYCTIELLEPYAPDEVEREDPVKFAEGVRDAMAAELGVDTTDHSYDDAVFFSAATRTHGAAHEIVDFQVVDVRKKFDVDVTQLIDWLKVFKNLDTDGSGAIERDEFLTHGNTRHLFDFCDTDSDGKITYRELVQLLAILTGKGSLKSQAMLAFHIYDTDDRGVIQVKGEEVDFDRFLHLVENTAEGPELLNSAFKQWDAQNPDVDIL